MAKETNSWAVRYREKNYIPKKDEEHHAWKIEVWFPSVIINAIDAYCSINGKKLETDSDRDAFDVGEVRAAHHAYMKSQHLPDFHWDVRKVYFAPHNEDKDWFYEGTQKKVFDY